VDVAAGHSPERHHLDELDEGQASYGSEGWGFESLRARAVLRQTTKAPDQRKRQGGGLARSRVDIGVVPLVRSAASRPRPRLTCV